MSPLGKTSVRTITNDVIRKEICRFTERSSANTLKKGSGEKAWNEPLVGFSGGNDPLYSQIQSDIGAWYWTPAEAFRRAFPRSRIRPEQLTVICWVLPQTDSTKKDHRKSTRYPSERWTRSRCFGEAFNLKLARHIVSFLKRRGIEAAAPVQIPGWQITTDHHSGFASSWSERHAAYVSGLGTFGLCDGLITPAGKAVRIGSAVARLTLQPTIRPYTSINQWCLFYSRGSCSACIDRCPAGALSRQGHDKRICAEYVINKMALYTGKRLGMQVYSCGLCQTGVPCESGIPKP